MFPFKATTEFTASAFAGKHSFEPEKIVGVYVPPMVHICYVDVKYHLKICLF